MQRREERARPSGSWRQEDVDEIKSAAANKEAIRRLIEKYGGPAGLARALQSDAEDGLSSNAVERHRELFGSNKLKEAEMKSFLSFFLEAFEDPTLLILVAAAILSLGFGFAMDKPEEKLQGAAICGAILLVSVVGAVQEYSRETQFHELNRIKADHSVLVQRDGRQQSVGAHGLVVGDVLLLAPGDRIPADAVQISRGELVIDEALMTGETKEVYSSSGYALTGGTLVQDGSGHAVVIAVGENSAMGKLIEAVEEDDDEDTPLQAKLSVLADQIGYLGFAAGGLVFVLLTWQWALEKNLLGLAMSAWWSLDWLPVLRAFIVGISIVVVAVPEGLPLSVLVALSFSMQAMLRDKNLIRKLAASETLGAITVLVSDKTGTLTTGKMTVRAGYSGGQLAMDPDSLAQVALGGDGTRVAVEMARAVALNSTAEVRLPGDEGYSKNGAHGIVSGEADEPEAESDADSAAYRERRMHAAEAQGNKTESALLCWVRTYLPKQLDAPDLRKMAQCLCMVPFSSQRKYMASAWVVPQDGRPRSGSVAAAAAAVSNGSSPDARTPRDTTAEVYVKGAPDRVLDMCGSMLMPDGSTTRLAPRDRVKAMQATDAMARRGLRTIAVASTKVRVGGDGGPLLPGGKLAGKGSDTKRASDGGMAEHENEAAGKWRNALVLRRYEASGSAGDDDGGMDQNAAEDKDDNESVSGTAADSGAALQDMVLLGVVGIVDPPRSDAKDALEKLGGAGVRVIMCTGDMLETAVSISRQVGVLPELADDESDDRSSQVDDEGVLSSPS